jgi:hypothetical protein
MDPVFAADGYTYDRTAIAEWFKKKNTSPMTREDLDKTLRPNLQLKSMISAWRAEREGEAAIQKGLKDHISRIQWSTTRDELTRELRRLNDFITDKETVVPTPQLRRLRNSLQHDEKLWCDGVKESLEVLEAQCEAGVNGYRQVLKKATMLEMVATESVTHSEATMERLKVKLQEAKEVVDEIELELKEAENDSDELLRLKKVYKKEMDDMKEKLEKALEEEKGDASGLRRSKRKRGAGDDGSAGGLHIEGLEWYFGNNFRVMDKRRGQLLIETAAEQGDACAEAECIYRGWGGRDEDEEEAFKRFLELSEEGHVEAMFLTGCCYDIGEGAAVDKEKATEWFTKAAEQGHSGAQIGLGVCYENGQGVAMDREKATEWFTKAAEQGNGQAQFKLRRSSTPTRHRVLFVD